MAFKIRDGSEDTEFWLDQRGPHVIVMAKRGNLEITVCSIGSMGLNRHVNAAEMGFAKEGDGSIKLLH